MVDSAHGAAFFRMIAARFIRQQVALLELAAGDCARSRKRLAMFVTKNVTLLQGLLHFLRFSR